MRDDLTANFQIEMVKDWRKPIQVMVFKFPESGNVYISDRDITIDGNVYLPRVENWGSLQDSADAKQDTGETTQLQITLINSGTTPFSDYFLYDDPENVEVDLYQTFDGLLAVDLALVDTFVIQDPISMNESSKRLTLDLVSRNIFYDGPVGELLNDDDWPNALESDIGKGIDLICGTPGKVKTLCAKTAPIVTLDGAIMQNSVNIDVLEQIEDYGFPASGYLLIDDEVIRYSSFQDKRFTVWESLPGISSNGNIIGRGWGSTARAEHMDGVEVAENIADYTYLVGPNPITSIGSVYLDIDYLAIEYNPVDESGDYTTFPASDPPRIIFNKKPRYTKFAQSSSEEEIQVNTFNESTTTADYPHQAFDEEPNSAAQLSETGRLLDVSADYEEIEDKGEVVSAYIEVTHWPNSFYNKTITGVEVDVSMDGVTPTFNLSQPNAQDILDIEEEWTLQHTHLYDPETDVRHNHPVTQPTVNTYVDPHGHVLDSDTISEVDGSINTGESTMSLVTEYYLPVDSLSVNPRIGIFYYDLDAPSGYTLDHIDMIISVRVEGGSLKIATSNSTRWVDGTTSVARPDIVLKGIQNHTGIYFDGYRNKGGTISSLRVYSISIVGYFSIDASIEEASLTPTSNVETDVGVNDRDAPQADVLEWLQDPIELDLSRENPGRTFVDRFDITDLVSTRPWSFFNGNEIHLAYVGSSDNDTIIMIIDVRLVVEYRPREIIYTNDVYCEPVALDDNRPDKVIQYLLESTGMSTGDMGNIVKDIPIWDYTDTWTYSDVWQSGGNVTDVAATPFDLAATRYNNLGYELDGVISAKDKVRETIKNICWQTRSRLIWTAGQASLVLREKPESWIVQDSLSLDEIQLKSVKVERQPVNEIINSLDLRYKKNHQEDDYDKVIKKTYQKSIDRHGTYPAIFEFDLVRKWVMAKDLTEFYIDQYRLPSTFFNVTAYLKHFSLEKTDVITVANTFGKLNLQKLIIRSVKRNFGSGKNRAINTIDLLLESINWTMLREDLVDSVTPLDEISVADALFANALALEELAMAISAALVDSVTPDDDFESEWLIRSLIEEDVTATDSPNIAFSLEFDEDIIVNDYEFFVYENVGFDTRPFDSVGFGGLLPLYGPMYEGVRVQDEITVELS